MGFNVRRFCESDAGEVAQLIAYTLRTVSIKDYSSEYIENLIVELSAENIARRAKTMNFYVVTYNEQKIVGCGAIAPLGDKTDDCGYYNVFVLPQYQGKGIGKLIINKLENDEIYLRSKRVEVHSSITACQFYLKIGYVFVGNKVQLDKNGLYHLEKCIK